MYLHVREQRGVKVYVIALASTLNAINVPLVVAQQIVDKNKFFFQAE